MNASEGHCFSSISIWTGYFNEYWNQYLLHYRVYFHLLNRFHTSWRSAFNKNISCSFINKIFQNFCFQIYSTRLKACKWNINTNIFCIRPKTFKKNVYVSVSVSCNIHFTMVSIVCKVWLISVVQPLSLIKNIIMVIIIESYRLWQKFMTESASLYEVRQ